MLPEAYHIEEVTCHNYGEHLVFSAVYQSKVPTEIYWTAYTCGCLASLNNWSLRYYHSWSESTSVHAGDCYSGRQCVQQ